MKSKYIQLISAITFTILAFVYLLYDDNAGMFGSLIMSKLCAVQYSIEEGKEKQ